jgi:hypothetical protein
MNEDGTLIDVKDGNGISFTDPLYDPWDDED